MNLTGNTINVLGRKLYERSDHFYQDETGLKYDYRGGKLYVERFAYGPKYPPTWFWIRPQAEPQPTPIADKILRDLGEL